MKDKLTHIVSTLERNERAVVLILAAIVMISGLVYSISLSSTLRFSDEREYLSIANNIATKGLYSLDGIHSTAERPPGFPLILSLFLFLGSNVVHLRLFNYVLFASAMFLLYKILQKSSSTLAGLIAAFLVLLYPVLFYTAGTLYSQTLGASLFLTFIYALFYSDTYSTKRAMLSGFAIGFLMLTIPTFVFVLVVTLLFLIFQRRDFKTPMVIILVSSIVIGAWVVRNYLVFDAFIPISTNSGRTLLIGNSPNTTANAGANVDLSLDDKMTASMSETERDAYYRSKAIKNITEDKQKYLVLYFQKVLNYFNYRNELATTTEASTLRDFVMFITYGPLLGLFLLRIGLFKRYPPTHIETFFIVLYLSNAFFQAIFFTRIRFRLPFDFLLIGVVANFVSNVLKIALKAGTAANTPNNDASFVNRVL